MSENTAKKNLTISSSFRVSPYEKESINEDAKRVGLSKSEYQRQACLGPIMVLKESIADKTLLNQLDKIGQDLNQLTKHAHVHKAYDSERLHVLLDELETLIFGKLLPSSEGLISDRVFESSLCEYAPKKDLTEFSSFRNSPDDKKVINDNAKKAGMSKSEYKRKACLDPMIVVDQNPDDTRLTFHLMKIGTNLNQLTKIKGVYREFDRDRLYSILDRFDALLFGE